MKLKFNTFFNVLPLYKACRLPIKFETCSLFTVFLMTQDNSIYIYIYIYIYIQSISTNHIRAVCKKTTCFGLVTGPSSGCTGLVRRLYNRYRLLYLYTGCPRRKGPNFGRVFLRSNYTDITQNTYIQSSMVTEILAREV